MAGIYIHIPFCVKKCSYCGFYSVSTLKLKDDFLKSLQKEMEMRAEEFNKAIKDNEINTLYIGGGTPSILTANEINSITSTLKQNFNLDHITEFTLEINPDDITDEFIEGITSKADMSVNRLSIGMQTMDDSTLRLFRRRHTAKEAKDAVRRVQRHGISNISLDLIYAYPLETMHTLINDIEQTIELEPKHISAYQLTYEEGTTMLQKLKRGDITPKSDDECVEMYNTVTDMLKQNGYEQYEVSNYSKAGFESQHNTSYWNFTPYLGLGPSAHSFYANDRMHNPPSVKEYIEKTNNKEIPTEREHMTDNELYNDYVITSMRTTKGLDKEFTRKRFGTKLYNHLIEQIHQHTDDTMTTETDTHIKFTRKGMLISDTILPDLLYVE